MDFLGFLWEQAGWDVQAWLTEEALAGAAFLEWDLEWGLGFDLPFSWWGFMFSEEEMEDRELL